MSVTERRWKRTKSKKHYVCIFLVSPWVRKSLKTGFISCWIQNHSVLSLAKAQPALTQNLVQKVDISQSRIPIATLTYKPNLQELPSLWHHSVNVFVHVYCNKKSILGKDVNFNSVGSRHSCVCVTVHCCWWMCQSPASSNTPLSSVRKSLLEFTRLHRLIISHMRFPFYLCQISSLFMTVIDMLINMFIALIIITLILP